MSIVVEGFHKNYDNTVAVAGISFAVNPGEILGLLGPNGAGKTTTLRALAGIIRPTQGRLLIAGHDIAENELAAKQALAYVPDDPQLFDRLTIWDAAAHPSGLKFVLVGVAIVLPFLVGYTFFAYRVFAGKTSGKLYD